MRWLALLTILAACHKQADRCERIHARIVALADDNTRRLFAQQTSTPEWNKMCRVAYTDETAACYERAKTQAETVDCPIKELRAPDQIPSADDCAKLDAHLREAFAGKSKTMIDGMTHSYGVACQRFMFKSELDCDLAATTSVDLGKCSHAAPKPWVTAP